MKVEMPPSSKKVLLPSTDVFCTVAKVFPL